MDFHGLTKLLDAKYDQVRYWFTILEKHKLVNPKRGKGTKWLFCEDDVQQFVKLKTLLDDGVSTAPEASKMMKFRISPKEASTDTRSRRGS
jgi:hypothetical protein